MDKNTLAIASYNSNGCGAGCMEYINKLCGFSDIVFVQEHWLFSKQLLLFNGISNVHSHSVSCMPNKEIVTGRPYG